jgi:transposase
MRLHEADPSKLLGGKGYDSDDIRRDLIDQGIEPVIPPRSNLKQFRRIATRYEKAARAFVSMLCIAAARLWIKTVNTA